MLLLLLLFSVSFVGKKDNATKKFVGNITNKQTEEMSKPGIETELNHRTIWIAAES